MRVDKVETKTEDGANRLILILDEEFEVTVDGYGSGDYAMRVRHIGCNPLSADVTAFLARANSRSSDEFWGEALTWAEPMTIAHLVADTIYNQ